MRAAPQPSAIFRKTVFHTRGQEGSLRVGTKCGVTHALRNFEAMFQKPDSLESFPEAPERYGAEPATEFLHGEGSQEGTLVWNARGVWIQRPHKHKDPVFWRILVLMWCAGHLQ